MISAPITSTLPYAAARCEAMAIPTSDPALAMGRSMAGTPGMPSAAPMEDAGPGKRRSLDPLAAKMKPISCACHSGALQAIARGEES